MSKAFVMLAADRVEPGPLQWIKGALQQRTLLFLEGECVCTLLVTYPAGSPEYEKARRLATVDGMPPRSDAIAAVEAAP